METTSRNRPALYRWFRNHRGQLMYALLGMSSTLWFLIRVIPKPSRAAYPCMRAVAPVMSGFVLWIMTLTGAMAAFKEARQRLLRANYLAATLFVVLGIVVANLYTVASDARSSTNHLAIWYKPNVPLGIARGIHPGRVAWGHNPRIASWDGTTGFWWEDRFNDQTETDKLLAQTLSCLTGIRNEKDSWNALFRFFNRATRSIDTGYRPGEKLTVKINQNNTYSHESNNEINANPQLVLSLLKSLVHEAGIPQESITVADPSRFITNNIFDKCHAAFPNVHYVDHAGGEGREQATFVEHAIPYSIDNGKVATGLAACVVGADYLINMAIVKGHVTQGVSLCAKNYFGCTSIEADWHKNAHSSGFSQNRDGLHTYSVYPDYLGHKDLGRKTMLFLIDGIYSDKFVNGTPAYRWSLAPFDNNWPCSLFASQDGVAIDAVVLDFALAEWPDAPDMMYSDYSVNESALADHPPSGTFYDPERSGKRLPSLGTSEHWNNPLDKRYSRNLKTGRGIELVYTRIGIDSTRLGTSR
ncbi:MAG TPA: DUF362 domain-containing protein [Bacteroidota bacterium]|nr:DUF362 domain-containing protein [Bacteroidota bacterium]